MDNYAEIKVELPVTQFVKLEAKAKENFHSADSEASFLLSKWVESTRKDGASPEPQSGVVCGGESPRTEQDNR